MLLVINQHITT